MRTSIVQFTSKFPLRWDPISQRYWGFGTELINPTGYLWDPHVRIDEVTFTVDDPELPPVLVADEFPPFEKAFMRPASMYVGGEEVEEDATIVTLGEPDDADPYTRGPFQLLDPNTVSYALTGLEEEGKYVFFPPRKPKKLLVTA